MKETKIVTLRDIPGNCPVCGTKGEIDQLQAGWINMICPQCGWKWTDWRCQACGGPLSHDLRGTAGICTKCVPEPKPDESLLLTPEEIKAIRIEPHENWLDGFWEWNRAIAKAQLAKDQFHERQTAERIFKEIEKMNLFAGEEPPVDGKPYQFLAGYITRWGKDEPPTIALVRLPEHEEWQALKAEELK